MVLNNPSVMQPPHSQNAERILGLDLLRAIAIILVMVSHWANNIFYWFDIKAPRILFDGGDIGVDLFFALSGFLIGRILIGIAHSNPSWRNLLIFMARRALRTLPLYFFWLAVLIIVWPPNTHAVVTALRMVTLTQNLIAPMPPDYFFAVSWSLTIEEWFYLLFAAALIVGARLLVVPSRAVWLCLAVFLTGPLALRVAQLGWNPYTFSMRDVVFFRIDEIAYGVLMAKLYLDENRLFRHPLIALLAGLLMIGSALTYRLPMPVDLMPALSINAAIMGCALCLPAALRLRRAARWFEAPVQWVSTRSYALYIVHLTVLVDFVQGDLVSPGRVSAPVGAALAVGLPFLLAEASYRILERPVLRRRPQQDAAYRVPEMVGS